MMKNIFAKLFKSRTPATPVMIEIPKPVEQIIAPRPPLVIEPPAPPVERFDPSGLMNRYMDYRD